jgi:hypothetical protein
MRDVVCTMSDLGEGGRWFQKLSMIVGATNPAMISSTLVADVNGTPNNPISPTTMSHIGTIHLAARLDSVDTITTFLLTVCG